MESRHSSAQNIRNEANNIASNRPHVRHKSNKEEQLYRRPCSKQPSYIANFTKGLPHDKKSGLLLNPNDYQQFVKGIQSGNPYDIEKIPLGSATLLETKGCLSVAEIDCQNPPQPEAWLSEVAKDKRKLQTKIAKKDSIAGVRAWESQAAGLIYDLEGPDAQAVTMPPAPTLDSDELAAEMAEVYIKALLRDTHFSQFRPASLCEPTKVVSSKDCPCECPPKTSVEQAVSMLQQLNWFQSECCHLSPEQKARQRSQEHLTIEHLFRGITPGDNQGPYISQFLLMGSQGINPNDDAYALTDQNKLSQIAYGAVTIDQRVRVAKPCKDYMTTFESWLDVQNGADLRGLETYLDKPIKRYITTPRDLATYVHYDALYEAYLNACLILLGMGAPLDPGLPFLASDVQDKQQGFATFGGPHILSLVTEVATRALKAVRYQKFNNHRRLRPEALAGLIDRWSNQADLSEDAKHELHSLEKITKTLDEIGLLKLINQHNTCQNKASDRDNDASANKNNYFLPMAFPEGSPMHPSYGAGHATVAGACVTILKAFFDTGWELTDSSGQPIAFEANKDGSCLNTLKLDKPLTVEGELNKIASNISIGRDWAGVHYFTDYIESLRMGEQIAIGILEEQKLTYHENFTMSIPLFDGGVIKI